MPDSSLIRHLLVFGAALLTIQLAGCSSRSSNVPVSKAAQVSMQCERYRVSDGQKVDRTLFTIAFTPKKDHLSYEKISGPDWVIPNECDLDLIWKSKDRLRFVAKWIDKSYENDDEAWHPVYIFDFDFGSLEYSVETAGGFSDFDEVIYDPWKCECKRLD